MPVIIDMPKLSDTMTVGTLVNWLKKEGDAVAPGDMIAEVETDKATMELENFEAGILLKQYVAVGQQVAIGAPICAIGKAGEVVPEVGAGSVAAVSGNEANTAASSASTDVSTANKGIEASVTTHSDGRIKASPLAKKIATEMGVPITQVPGTGPDGRIVKKDVLAAAVAVSQPASVVDVVKAVGTSKSVTQPVRMPVFASAVEDKEIPVTNMRATIARRLVESKTQTPHFYLQIEVDAEPLMKMRTEINDGMAASFGENAPKFTVNDFILKASAEALRRVPAVNASWQGNTILQHGNIHLAFGVAIEDGLLTPVIRDCGVKGLRQISLEAKELIQKAKSKKLKPEEMVGSTFTVTNLGMFGITNFYGIINPPNAAILSVGGTTKQPVVLPDNTIGVGYRMNIGLSGDHRVVDGANAAKFLSELKLVLEKPTLMLV